MKIFKMNDCEWVAAETLDEAKQTLANTVNDGKVGPEFEDEFIDEPRELIDEELDRLKFREEEYDDCDDLDEKGDPRQKGGESKTFREKLNEMIAEGETFPTHFASTEF